MKQNYKFESKFSLKGNSINLSNFNDKLIEEIKAHFGIDELKMELVHYNKNYTYNEKTTYIFENFEYKFLNDCYITFLTKPIDLELYEKNINEISEYILSSNLMELEDFKIMENILHELIIEIKNEKKL